MTMFGFPHDLFSMHGFGNRRPNPNNASNHNQQGIMGNSMLMPMPLIGSPFSGFNDFFNNFGIGSSPFAMMDRMMQRFNSPSFVDAASTSTGPVHSFSSTTIMSYGGPNGQPKVYQESTSRTRGPGGLEETRQAVRDSERGINKVQIGHRIGDRKHVIEREMNTQTGQVSENIELENLDETETDQFKREWREKSARAGLPQRRSHYRPQAALPSNRFEEVTSHQHRGPLAIEYTGSQRNISEPVDSKNQRTLPRHSDTLDLTEDSTDDDHDDVQEIEAYPEQQTVKSKSSSTKRKASWSSSNEGPNQRKHRPKRS